MQQGGLDDGNRVDEDAVGGPDTRSHVGSKARRAVLVIASARRRALRRREMRNGPRGAGHADKNADAAGKRGDLNEQAEHVAI